MFAAKLGRPRAALPLKPTDSVSRLIMNSSAVAHAGQSPMQHMFPTYEDQQATAMKRKRVPQDEIMKQLRAFSKGQNRKNPVIDAHLDRALACFPIFFMIVRRPERYVDIMTKASPH